MNNIELKLENEWLQQVLKEIEKQLNEKSNFKKKFRDDAIETQRQLWNDIGSVSITNGLDQIVDFIQFINTMKTQKRTHEFTRKLEEKYKKMLLSPYFGRIDFLESGDEKSEKYYIGISNLINDNYDFMVYDWRSPVSSMFYDYEIGDAGYECPEGIINGKVTLKRQYKIYKDKIEYMFDSNLKIDDEILQNILSKNTDSKMKAIATTIQREQNKVIRNEEYKNLIVQGPAGSGKTSVALHRIAYLLYKHRDKITPENIIIFSPNEIFNDYISNVLPELGEDTMYQTTFNEYMNNSLCNNLIKETYCQMMEYILASKKHDYYETRINSIKFKSSLEFINILKQYVVYLEKKNRNFTDIILRDHLIISSNDIQELFFKDYSQLPLKRRLHKIKERILFLLEPYKKRMIAEVANELRNSGDYVDKIEIMELSKTSIDNEMKSVYHEIDKITAFDLLSAYKKLFENLEFFLRKSNTDYDEKIIDDIKIYTLQNIKAEKLNYEDQPPLLYLKGVLEGLPKTLEIKYVIIDEAQDYTPLQYEIFHQLFNSANITMLGDLNQSINPFMNVGNYNNISNIFPKDNTCIINLTKSYRSTMEITKFSRKLLNKNITDEYIERSGNKPSVLGFSNEEAIKERLINEVIKSRRSIRKFKTQPIPDKYIQEIIEAGRLAPSVSNIQSTRYVIIKSSEVKEKLNEYTVPFVKNAPVVIVCCAYKKAWLEQEEKFLELKNMGAFKDFYQETEQQINNFAKDGKLERMANPEIDKYYTWQHAAIAIDHMTLKAVDLGLGSCWVGFVDREKVRKLINLNEDYEVIALLPIGYPSYNPLPRPRLSILALK